MKIPIKLKRDIIRRTIPITVYVSLPLKANPAFLLNFVNLERRFLPIKHCATLIYIPKSWK